MAEIIYKNDKMAKHGHTYICQYDKYISFIFGGEAHARRIYRDFKKNLEYFAFKKERYYLEDKNIPDQAVVYKVRTTFLGADNSSEFYFFDIETAKKYLDSLENGEIRAILLKNVNNLGLANGFVYDDLEYFNPDIEIVEL